MAPNKTPPENEDIVRWADIPAEERMAMRRAARSQIWWSGLAKRFIALGPFISVVLAIIALWVVLGEAVRDWLSGR